MFFAYYDKNLAHTIFDNINIFGVSLPYTMKTDTAA